MGDLVYSFPILGPMNVLHVDIYEIGTDFNYEGNKHYLIACCGMITFSVIEPTSDQSSKVFASVIMKIWTHFSFSHTIAVDKDSKFCGVFTKTAKLLGINLHVLSGENPYDPMLIERVNCFLNASLTIFCNKRGMNKASQEGVLMSLYPWNSVPVPGSDISRSLIVVDQEFQFPIDLSARKPSVLTLLPGQVKSFAIDQAHLLLVCRRVAEELTHHHRTYHHKLINSQRGTPHIFENGDKVSSRRAVRSDKKRGIVANIQNPHT